VRVERDRKKKLIVAFHFLSGNQAGWKCEPCRRQGLEGTRRCGFIAEEQRGARRVVWARGRAATEECPRSWVTPESVVWVEWYFAWKSFGGGGLAALGAKEADVMLTLEKEWREARNGNQQDF